MNIKIRQITNNDSKNLLIFTDFLIKEHLGFLNQVYKEYNIIIIELDGGRFSSFHTKDFYEYCKKTILEQIQSAKKKSIVLAFGYFVPLILDCINLWPSGKVEKLLFVSPVQTHGEKFLTYIFQLICEIFQIFINGKKFKNFNFFGKFLKLQRKTQDLSSIYQYKYPIPMTIIVGKNGMIFLNDKPIEPFYGLSDNLSVYRIQNKKNPITLEDPISQKIILNTLKKNYSKL